MKSRTTEAETYLLVLVSETARVEDAGFFFLLWPSEHRPMLGATLAFRPAEGDEPGTSSVFRRVRVGVRHAVAVAYSVSCGGAPR